MRRGWLPSADGIVGDFDRVRYEEPAEGFSLTHAESAIEDADRISGDHRPEDVIVAARPSVRPFETERFGISGPPGAGSRRRLRDLRRAGIHGLYPSLARGEERR
jgi:hypothetical protein